MHISPPPSISPPPYTTFQVPSILQVDYVECQCSSLGEFAVSGAVEIAYGWSLPAALSAAVVMIVIIPVVLLHLCYRNRTQLATRILTALCVSIFLFEVSKIICKLGLTTWVKS